MEHWQQAMDGLEEEQKYCSGCASMVKSMKVFLLFLLDYTPFAPWFWCRVIRKLVLSTPADTTCWIYISKADHLLLTSCDLSCKVKEWMHMYAHLQGPQLSWRGTKGDSGQWQWHSMMHTLTVNRLYTGSSRKIGIKASDCEDANLSIFPMHAVCCHKT